LYRKPKGVLAESPSSPPFGGEEFQTNLIMPEPCPFLSRKLAVCSIIRPTETNEIAMNVVNFLTSMGLFIGQSTAFFKLLRDLAEDADAARRGQISCSPIVGHSALER
jgi:hypothetical protein